MPDTVTEASSSPALASRSRLTCRKLLAGLKKATNSPPSASAGTVPTSEVTNPSRVRTYASAATSASVSRNRQSPRVGAPVPGARPLSALPISRSVELKCATAPGASRSVESVPATPPSSVAAIETGPPEPPKSMTRRKPWRASSPPAGNSGTDAPGGGPSRMVPRASWRTTRAGAESGATDSVTVKVSSSSALGVAHRRHLQPGPRLAGRDRHRMAA